jgi:hypothetical protein
MIEERYLQRCNEVRKIKTEELLFVNQTRVRKEERVLKENPKIIRNLKCRVQRRDLDLILK